MNKNQDINNRKKDSGPFEEKSEQQSHNTSSGIGEEFTSAERNHSHSQKRFFRDSSESIDDSNDESSADKKYKMEDMEVEQGNDASENQNKINAGETDQNHKDKNSEMDTGDDRKEENCEEIIARLKEELAQTKETMLRKISEFENLKRRSQKEKFQLFEEARADAVSRFLPIREDLIRSLEASKDNNVDQAFLEGLELVVNNFDKVLKDYNVEPIEETGVPFDVDKHDAMLTQPASEKEIESNTVLQILEPGYKIGDRVIKHAKVIVSQ